MANKDTNKKIHKDAISRDKVNPKYGFVYGEWFECGSHHFKYENADEPEKFFQQKVTASGSYKHTAYDKDDKEHIGQFDAGEVRAYTQGGRSDQFDGHLDLNAELTGREEYGKDHGFACKNESYNAVGGQRHVVSKKGKTTAIAGSSLEHNINYNGATTSSRNKGDSWSHTDGHTASYTTKSNIQYTEEEDSRYTGGNYDRYVDKKYHVYSKDAYVANTDSTFNTWSKQDMTMQTDAKGNFKSKSDMTIESDSKITIKVGGSSVVIESGSITIKSAQIKFEQG